MVKNNQMAYVRVTYYYVVSDAQSSMIIHNFVKRSCSVAICKALRNINGPTRINGVGRCRITYYYYD